MILSLSPALGTVQHLLVERCDSLNIARGEEDGSCRGGGGGGGGGGPLEVFRGSVQRQFSTIEDTERTHTYQSSYL